MYNVLKKKKTTFQNYFKIQGLKPEPDGQKYQWTDRGQSISTTECSLAFQSENS